MIKISHTQLESAKKEPRQFIERMGSTRNFPPSRKRYLQWSIRCHYHKDGGIRGARRYLQRGFSKRNFTVKSYDQFLTYLEDYHDDFESGPDLLEVICLGDRIQVELSEDCILTGEIDRVDLTSEGYSVWIFDISDYQWEQELRMPLIQQYYADHFGAPVEEVSVGFYFFDVGVYQKCCFTESEIAHAKSVALKLAEALLEYGEL